MSPRVAPARLLFPQPGVAGRGQHLVQGRGVFAGVVDRPGRGGERELLRRHQVPAAHLGRVHADLRGEVVHRPLDRRGGLRAARAAVGGHRRGVGHHRPVVRPDVRDVVDAAGHQHGELGQRGAEAGVTAAVLDDVELIGEDAPVPASRRSCRSARWARPCTMPEQVFAAGLRPADRAAGVLGGRRDADHVPVHPDLGTEPAADIGRDDPDRRRVKAQPAGDRVPRDLRVLGAAPDGEPVHRPRTPPRRAPPAAPGQPAGSRSSARSPRRSRRSWRRRSSPPFPFRTTLLSDAGNSSTSPLSAAPAPGTAVSGSYSTLTSSAASSPW